MTADLYFTYGAMTLLLWAVVGVKVYLEDLSHLPYQPGGEMRAVAAVVVIVFAWPFFLGILLLWVLISNGKLD